MGLKDIDKGLKNILRELDKVSKKVVDVGIMYDSGRYKDKGKEKGDTQQPRIVDVARDNEFGTAWIPARPAHRQAFDNNITRINRAIDNKVNRIKRQKITWDKALSDLGRLHQRHVRKRIVDLKTPPNSLITIMLKNSSNPLINTNTMRRAVTYVVRRIS